MAQPLTQQSLQKARIATGSAHWLSLFSFETEYGLQDVVARTNGLLTACKVMPLILSGKQAKSFKLRGELDLKS